MKRLLILPFIILLWSACTEDHLGNDNDICTSIDRDESVIRFTVVTPGATVYSSYSRSGQLANTTQPESVINDIQILVFEAGKYLYRVPGASITTNDNQASFTARLKASSTAIKLMILANVTHDIIDNDPLPETSEIDIKKMLTRSFTADGITSPFPMYGEYTLSNGLSGGTLNNIGTVKMLRAIARIDIQAGEVTNFKLSSLQAYRTTNKIQFIPNQNTIIVTAPSIPLDASASVATNSLPISGTSSISQLYLPEAAAPASGEETKSACCIVIGGYYGTDLTPTYYRVDFNSENQDGTFGQILRNHRYIFNIKKVLAPGWTTPVDAANNKSSQIQVEVQSWEDSTTDMYFDGEHHFGLSTREIQVAYKENSSAKINVSTDIQDYSLQWVDNQNNPIGTPATSLNNSEFSVVKSSDGSIITVTTLQANLSTDTVRTRKFLVTANRWKIIVTIKQTEKKIITRMINLISFYDGLGYLGTNLILPKQSAESRGQGLYGILSNTKNFGLTGTVECGGFNMIRSNVSANNLSELFFSTADVVYVNYMSTGSFGITDSKNVHNWLKAKKNRVLLVAIDGSGININLLNELLGGITNISWSQTSTNSFPVAGKSSSNYFTDAGPFTQSPYTPISSDFKFRCYDSSHGEIKPAGSSGITPLLMSPDNTNIVLGFDLNKRIVYVGDIDLFSASSGGTGTTDNYIKNTTGDINNNASKLIANLFAKIVEIVLKE
ncbi:fimbrial protein [Coprobacter tertius]|uniref:Fimbrial protein n=1 Tax=Coprobacter tertius TaxID=2944915 RepID=A0ABT1ME69_9BACT|nr:fimbrial protein [Coprobacter tertius]MCP9610927.1 fimbrial protein [Coprobacter tertius]